MANWIKFNSAALVVHFGIQAMKRQKFGHISKYNNLAESVFCPVDAI